MVSCLFLAETLGMFKACDSYVEQPRDVGNGTCLVEELFIVRLYCLTFV